MHIGLWSSRVVLSFAFDQFSVMGIGLHPDMWQSRGPHWWSPLSQKMPGAWFGTNAHKQKHKHTRGTPRVRMCVCACSSLWLAEGWGWQVLNCAEVERAAMGISRFTTLVRKLTNQSCFLFCSSSLNGAPSCPSCNHRRPRNCTDVRVGSPLVLPHFLFSFLSLAVFIYLCLSLYSAPPCLVRGQIYLSHQTGEAYTSSLPHMGRGIFSQRENWHAIIMF